MSEWTIYSLLDELQRLVGCFFFFQFIVSTLKGSNSGWHFMAYCCRCTINDCNYSATCRTRLLREENNQSPRFLRTNDSHAFVRKWIFQEAISFIDCFLVFNYLTETCKESTKSWKAYGNIRMNKCLVYNANKQTFLVFKMEFSTSYSTFFIVW